MSMDAGALAESLHRDAGRRLAAYRELRAAVERLAVTARSPDGGVRVTVRAGGAVTDVRLTEDALRQGADRLGRAVRATLEQAQARVAARLARLAQTYAGDRFDVVGVVQGRLPSTAGAAR